MEVTSETGPHSWTQASPEWRLHFPAAFDVRWGQWELSCGANGNWAAAVCQPSETCAPSEVYAILPPPASVWSLECEPPGWSRISYLRVWSGNCVLKMLEHQLELLEHWERPGWFSYTKEKWASCALKSLLLRFDITHRQTSSEQILASCLLSLNFTFLPIKQRQLHWGVVSSK